MGPRGGDARESPGFALSLKSASADPRDGDVRGRAANGSATRSSARERRGALALQTDPEAAFAGNRGALSSDGRAAAQWRTPSTASMRAPAAVGGGGGRRAALF